MRPSHSILAAVALISLTAPAAAPGDADAVTRRSRGGPFDQRSAVSATLGLGLPLGDFSDDQLGNHDSGGTDWTVEFEHYVTPGLSLGAGLNLSRYTDQTYGDNLRTKLTSFNGFLRYTYPSSSAFHPFIRLGAGSMEVRFDEPGKSVDAENTGTIHVGGGFIILLARSVGVLGQARYTYAWSDDSVIYEEDAVVGFDVSTLTFSLGLSVMFP